MSVRLYVGNLPKDVVERDELQAVFGEENDNLSIKVIKDRKTGKCRGFAFVTVPDDEVADELIEKHNGQAFRDSALKIEKALPRSKGKKEEGQEEAPQEETSKSVNSGAGGGGGAPKQRRGGGKKQKQRGGSGGAAANAPDSGAVQPDPRWADELAKLKEMLAAQNS